MQPRAPIVGRVRSGQLLKALTDLLNVTMGLGCDNDSGVIPSTFLSAGPPGGFSGRCAAQYRTMNLRKPLLLLALVGSLVACGDNTDVQRGETNCDSAGEQASNPQDASCEETGTPGN